MKLMRQICHNSYTTKSKKVIIEFHLHFVTRNNKLLFKLLHWKWSKFLFLQKKWLPSEMTSKFCKNQICFLFQHIKQQHIQTWKEYAIVGNGLQPLNAMYSQLNMWISLFYPEEFIKLKLKMHKYNFFLYMYIDFDYIVMFYYLPILMLVSLVPIVVNSLVSFW